jgi:hypothetical protein
MKPTDLERMVIVAMTWRWKASSWRCGDELILAEILDEASIPIGVVDKNVVLKEFTRKRRW